jgi:uncharacterized membrane protein
MVTKTISLNNPIQHRQIILAVLLIAILSLQIAATQMRSFWEDEAYTGWLITRDYPTIIENVKADVNNNPPLYWLSVFIWSKVFGTNEFGLKSFSILWMVFVCLLTYKMAKDLFNVNVALIALGLLAFSPFVLTYAHNARYYSMAAALSLLLVLLLFKYTQTNNWRYLLFYILTGTGLLYTVYMGATELLAINLWWIFQWARGNRKFSHLIVWVLAQATILLFYAPWISTAVTTFQRNLPSELGGGNWLMEIVLRVGYLFYAFGVGEFFSPLNPLMWLGIILITGLILFALMKSTHNLWLPVSLLLVVGVISVGFNLIALYPQSAWQNLPSRSFFVYPFFVMILAYGISRIKGKWSGAAFLVVLMVYGVGIFNYFSNREVIKPILIVPWREIMAHIEDTSIAEPVVICTNADFACFYYQTRYGFKPLSPANWPELSIQRPAEIWWVQSNLGDKDNSNTTDKTVFTSVQTQYQETDILNYAPQDQGIAILKSKFLGYQPYPYRVVVHRLILR